MIPPVTITSRRKAVAVRPATMASRLGLVGAEDDVAVGSSGGCASMSTYAVIAGNLSGVGYFATHGTVLASHARTLAGRCSRPATST